VDERQVGKLLQRRDTFRRIWTNFLPSALMMRPPSMYISG